MMERVLAISAHCDDSEFGALGTLLNHKDDGHIISLLAFTAGRNISWIQGMWKILKG
jgi:LmbE family N-acetylglucosaminyl deacetylase